MVTKENLAGQRKQLGHEVCTTAVVTPSQECGEGEDQLGLCKLRQQGFAFLVQGRNSLICKGSAGGLNFCTF